MISEKTLRCPALKTHFFCEKFTRRTQRLRDFHETGLNKFTLYLLTYLPKITAHMLETLNGLNFSLLTLTVLLKTILQVTAVRRVF